MPRVARVVVADVAHHVTQRGNGRQFILASDAERLVYLDLLRQAARTRARPLLSCVTFGARPVRDGLGGRENPRGGWKKWCTSCPSRSSVMREC